LTRGKRPQASPERTEAERERDRAERERRRAERAAGQGGQAAAPAALDANGLAGKSPVDPLEPPPAEDADAPMPPPLTTGELVAGDAPAEHHPADALAPPDSAPVEPGPGPVAGSDVAERDAAGITEGEVGVGEAAGARPPLPPAPYSSAPASTPRPSIAGRRSGRVVRRPGGGSPVTRLLALLALAAVVTAVVLLVKSLSGSSQPSKTVVPGVVKVVIPEGKTRVQIAHIAASDGLSGSYRGASKRSPLLNPAHYGAPSGTRDLEGFLFPATYDMYTGAPVSKLVQEQLIAFRENFGPTEIARAHALHVTPYELLTIASMVEREAKVPGDRAKIAAVIYNRLKKGMPLGIDATIYYALELETGIPTYTKELTEAQLQLNSPYNTRTHTGLPPTPISNPGLASIEAAGHPAPVAYLYYVLAADGCGEHTFSTTLAKFEADAAAYQGAVRNNGGAPPTCKTK
jgi:cell division protein YceG involved in septum cleavage